MTASRRVGAMSIWKLLGLIFVPTLIVTTVYVIVGFMQDAIPSFLLFFLCAAFILFPIEIGIVRRASKEEYGRYSLRSSFSRHSAMSWWRVLLYASVLFGFSGIMSVTIAPLENNLVAPISDRLAQITPAYFDWSNIEYLKQYSSGMVLLACIGYFVLNVIVGPIVEELFFRGYLTAKISRFGNLAPVIVTILFSLYHLWLPFNNLFRIAVFLPSALVVWRKNNIYIGIVFHCLCNAISAISFISSVYSG